MAEYREASTGLAFALPRAGSAARIRPAVLAAATGAAAPRAPVGTRVFWSVAAAVLAALTLYSLLHPGAQERVPLRGTKDAPSARGEACGHGYSVEVSVLGLPALPPGRVYQLWHLGVGAEPVAARTFTLDAWGELHGSDTLRHPLGPGQGFAITMEPEGGSRRPTSSILVVPAP